MTAQPRTAKDLFAAAAAAEHAATLALQKGNVTLAQALGIVGKLRHDMALRQAAAECPTCHGHGQIWERCPAGCTEHDEPGRTGRHWISCPNVVTHPPLAATEPAPVSGRIPCNPGGTPGYHKGDPQSIGSRPAR
ncbi:hypothetical protein ACFRR6_24555 [Streptomyces sp. NPDC056891]|uniref:hypothetical protein n=1 Tax=Streptomyces sp. NPDC056891 TaxID=3345961 RepID=UPI0036936A70